MSKLLELSEEFAKEAFAANLCSITIHEDDSDALAGPRLRINHVVPKEQVPMPILNCINIMGLANHLQDNASQFHQDLAQFLMDYDPSKVESKPSVAANDAAQVAGDTVGDTVGNPAEVSVREMDMVNLARDARRYDTVRAILLAVLNDEEGAMPESIAKAGDALEALNNKADKITVEMIDQAMDIALT